MNEFKPGLLPRTTPSPHKLIGAPAGYYPPSYIDRRMELLSASNQGNTSQCVAFALAGWLEFYRWKYHGDTTQIDPAPIYNRAKQIDNFPNEEGTSLQAGLQAAQDLTLMSAVAQESIREVRTEAEVRQALHRYGVVFGCFRATDQWAKAGPDGWMKMDGAYLGGHAVLLCGYSTIDEPYFAIQNSWGESVGWKGFERMSPEQFNAEFDYGLTWEFAK